MGSGDSDEDDESGCAMTGVLAVLLVPALLGLLLPAGVSWWRERDLRDLSALETTTARVVEYDSGGKYGRDEYEVVFTADGGGEVRTEIPVDGPHTATEVEVAYVPDDPTRVRTVEHWEPLYAHLVLLGVVLVATAPLLVAWSALRGLLRRRRRGRLRPR